MPRDDALAQAVSSPRFDWDAPGLQAQWRRLGDGRWGGLEVRVVAQTASTNDDLLALARQVPASDLAPIVLVAESQTHGRGRLGRSWAALPGASLTLSIGMCLSPERGWAGLSLVVGHALAQALQPWDRGACGPQSEDGRGRLMLKWPNDLWWIDSDEPTPAQRAAGRKLAGVLIETLPLPRAGGAAGARWVVVGIGINRDASALASLGVPGTALAGTLQWRPEDEPPALLRAVTPSVLQAVEGFERHGFEPFRDEIQARDVLVGQHLTLQGAPIEEGWCEGLDADGALRVRRGDMVHRVIAGQASVRPVLQARSSDIGHDPFA